MKKVANLFLALVLTEVALTGAIAGHLDQRKHGLGRPDWMFILPPWSPARPLQGNASIASFWDKFKSAVIKCDKAAVAGLSQFPISMPYGMPTVRTKAQLIRRYRDVFNHEGSAAKCFATAQPQTDPARPKEFSVACKNAAGDEVIIYSFKRVGKTWAFSGLDNINE